MQAAIEGQGIALARSSLIGNDLVNGVLVRLFDIEVPSPWRYYLVYPPSVAQSPKLAVFRKWLALRIQRQAEMPQPTANSATTLSSQPKRRAFHYQRDAAP